MISRCIELFIQYIYAIYLEYLIYLEEYLSVVYIVVRLRVENPFSGPVIVELCEA